MIMTMIETNLAVVDAHMRGEVADPASIMGLYGEGIVLDLPSHHRQLTTLDSIQGNYEKLFGSIRLLDMKPLDRFATEDRVVDDCIVTFTVTGDGYEGLPYPVGAILEMRLLHIFQMQDGKIMRETVFETWKPAQ